MFFNKYKYLIISILVMVLISYGHLISSNSLIAFGLFIFLTTLIIAEDIYKVSILFLFVSFNGLLKINLEGNSFFGFGVLICVAIFLFKKYKIKNFHLLFILFIYTLSVKLVMYDSITLRYFFTFIYLILISFLASNRENKKLVDFELFVIFFVIGTVASNFIASLITKLPKFYVLTKGAEVQLEESWGIFRFAGFNGDPNRNALQIMFAIGCLLILIEKSKRNRIISYLGVIILLYYGFQSVSKMFYLILVLMTLVYFTYIFLNNRKGYHRLFFSITFITVFLVLINTEFVQNQLELVIERNMRTGSNDITTGRKSLQLQYINYLIENLVYLFFGRGFLTDFKPGLNVPHNSILQGIFGLGVFGFLLFLKAVFPILNIKNKNFFYSKQNILLYSILIITFFVGVLSLDLLNMDAFYFYLILFFFASIYIFKNTNKNCS